MNFIVLLAILYGLACFYGGFRLSEKLEELHCKRCKICKKPEDLNYGKDNG